MFGGEGAYGQEFDTMEAYSPARDLWSKPKAVLKENQWGKRKIPNLQMRSRRCDARQLHVQ